jgi:cell division initiation protein
MPYTPVELRHVHVKRSLLGYKRDAVENLLTELADNFETVWRERHELADHVEEIEHEVGVLRSREQALTQTLVAAEQAATHVKDQAKREAEVILAEARSEARALLRDAEGERVRLEAEVRRIAAVLRSALGVVEEVGPGRGAVPVEQPEEAAPAHPQLLKVSGGREWGGEG